ncbi:MAG: cobalamin-dependent protein [Deltaproteobacteria bacterium]|jgi:methanogenic corrinoid protein MtbC1|nr:cobalamin-dependent protein [Deltaproteobacteria bacterium]
MILEQIKHSLFNLDREETISLTVQAILEKMPPREIVLHGLLPGLGEVAEQYEKKEHIFPDMFKAAIIFQEALAKIKHQFLSMETDPGVWGVIGLARGDMQDFGKNIVCMTLEAKGFTVRDLGKSVPPEEFLQAAEDGADFIAISIMTDGGVQEAEKVVQGLKEAGTRERVKVIVGGAGVNARTAAEIIGADGYAENADEVVEFLKIFFRVGR